MGSRIVCGSHRMLSRSVFGSDLSPYLGVCICRLYYVERDTYRETYVTVKHNLDRDGPFTIFLNTLRNRSPSAMSLKSFGALTHSSRAFLCDETTSID